jgi:glycosyltransferase
MLRISIITIVFNGVKNIEDCIQSVLAQNYENLEHIVVDGGSTDGTSDIVKKYQDQIAVVIREKDKGLYDALNKGILASTGDLIGVLHSDDLFYSSQVLQMVDRAFSSKHIDVLYGDGVYCKPDDPTVIKRIYPGGCYKKYKLYLGWMPLHTTMFVRREVYVKHGLYDKKFVIAGDYDVCLKWFFDDDLVKYYLKTNIVIMRIGGRSTVMHLQKKKSTEDLLIIRRHNLLGLITLMLKIGRKVPQYFFPYFSSKKKSHNVPDLSVSK